MKVEIEKEICNICGGGGICPDNRCAQKTCNKLRTTTSSLTALIIKWLEGKRGQQCLASGEYERNKMFGRNQLITELVEELK